METIPPYVLAIDIGTSSTRASVYDARGNALPGACSSHRQTVNTTRDGGAEMRADEVVEHTVGCVEEVLQRAGAAAGQVAGVAVCTYWHSVLGVGPSGRAVTPVYLWSDTRSAPDAERLRERVDAAGVYQRTGCPVHASYVAPKLLWFARAYPRRLGDCRYWMSIGEYFFLRLFGQARLSHSMASGTGMYDSVNRRWDPEVLAALPITPDQLTRPGDFRAPSRGLRREYGQRLPALRQVPWFPALGDGACSNVGSGAVTPRQVALMVGSSGAMRALFESGRPDPPEGLWAYLLDAQRSLLGGALSNGGRFYTWLAKTLRLGPREELEEELARMRPDAHGLTVLPFLMGERSPGWKGEARAVVAGLAESTRPLDVLRAGLEAVAYRFALIFERLRARLGEEAERDLRVIATGGTLLRSPAWMQILADVLNEPVVASREHQASSRGAALMALEALGLIPHIGAADFRWAETYSPDAGRHERYRAAIARQRELYRRILEAA